MSNRKIFADFHNATGRRPLLGTALLKEHELVVQFAEGGLVTIEQL